MTPALDVVLRHNLWANRRLLDFCASIDPALLDRGTPGTYGTLLATLQHLVSGEQWYVELKGDDADRRVTVDEKPWPAGIIYAQLVHHGNEHRGQAKSILGASGIEPPGVSAWGYAMDDITRDGAEL